MRSTTTTAWYQAPTTASGRFGGRFDVAGDLGDPVAVAALLAHPETRQHVTREQWRDLWDQWGLNGLVALSRDGGDEPPDAERDEARSRELIDAALAAGFDPLSGLLGTYSARDRTFEISPVQ